MSTPASEMTKLQVIIQNADSKDGKNVVDSLFSLYQKSGIRGATAWRGIKGYGRRGEVHDNVFGIAPSLPIIVETIAESPKIIAVLSKVKEIVGDRGVIVLQQVQVV